MDTDFFIWHWLMKISECIKPEMRSIWNEMRSNDCTFFFMLIVHFFPGTCCHKHIEHHKREPGLF